MPKTLRKRGSDGSRDPLRWTGMFAAGLKLGMPYAQLVKTRLPVLVMMLESQVPMDSGKASGTRRATQKDIDVFASM